MPGVNYFHWDVSQAYLWAELDQDIYMEKFEGMDIPDGSCLKLKKCLYGLKQSAAKWNEKLVGVLKDLGFVQSQYDHCLWLLQRKDKWVALCVFVDDMAGFTNDNNIRDEILKELNAKFKTEDRGDLKWFLATAFERNISEGYVDLL